MPPEVVFSEEEEFASKRNVVAAPRGLTAWLIAKHIARDAAQANIVMAVIIAMALLLAGFFFKNAGYKNPPVPQAKIDAAFNRARTGI